MSLEKIELEIKRFLSSSIPEVLCIKGKWGVGKTHAWRKFLKEAQDRGDVYHKNYSYVSLFGLNSLEDLRFAIFERTLTDSDSGGKPDETTFNKLINGDGSIARRIRPLVELGSAILNRKNVADILFKSAFLTVKNQLICLDDLERAGAGLSLRDVLGLASSLKEERECKVVLLLNDQEHVEKLDFYRQIEKVSDTTVTFTLTSKEATSIAIQNESIVCNFILPRIIDLKITNIRVIKKIEHIAIRLHAIISHTDIVVIEKAMATLVLSSWALQQPNEAPSIDFLYRYNDVDFMRSLKSEGADTTKERYLSIIRNYPYHGAGELDKAIIRGVENGYFEEASIRKLSEEAEKIILRSNGGSNYSKVWRILYHGSLTTDDNVFLEELFKSACEESALISLTNINSAIRMLRKFGWSQKADQLIECYINAHHEDGLKFFDLQSHHFLPGDPIDDGLREAFATRYRNFDDPRDPMDVLIHIGETRNWSDEDFLLMSKQSIDDFERMFEALKGEQVHSSIEMILSMGTNSRRNGASAINQATVAALVRIGKKSPIRAQKVRQLGVDVEAMDATPDTAINQP